MLVVDKKNRIYGNGQTPVISNRSENDWVNEKNETTFMTLERNVLENQELKSPTRESPDLGWGNGKVSVPQRFSSKYFESWFHGEEVGLTYSFPGTTSGAGDVFEERSRQWTDAAAGRVATDARHDQFNPVETQIDWPPAGRFGSMDSTHNGRRIQILVVKNCQGRESGTYSG